MGAKKPIDVNGAATNENTQPSPAGCTVAGFKLCTAASGGTEESNFIPFATGNKVVPAAGMLNIVDAGVFLFLGAAGTPDGQLSNAKLISMLDSAYPTGASTLFLKFILADKVTESDIPRFAVDAWGAAVAY